MVWDSYLAPLGWNLGNSRFSRKRRQKLVFGAETEYTTFTVVSSVFVRERQTGNPCSGRGGPENVPFFFWPRKSYQKPFSEETQFWAKNRVFRRVCDKKPIFIEEFSEGLRTSKTKQRTTTRGDSSVQHFSRAFLCGQSSVSGKAPSPKNDISANEVS